MSRYHINDKNEILRCRATKRKCRYGENMHFATREQAAVVIQSLSNSSLLPKDDWEFNKNTLDKARMYFETAADETITEEEFNERCRYVDMKTREALENKQDTASLYFDGDSWTKERNAIHEEIIDELMEKYKNVPSEGKSIFSAGISGAGKTTVLTEYENIDSNNYATVSSDDFKELLAERGLVPNIEGLTPMEASTLVHNESSYLADKLLNKLTLEKKNIVYDFTAKSRKGIVTRMETLIKSGYDPKDSQFVFVDINIDTSKQRARARYMYGMGSPMGGRYLPEAHIETMAPERVGFNSKNAHVLVDFVEEGCYNIPIPIIYDNSGAYPVRKTFNDLKGGKL